MNLEGITNPAQLTEEQLEKLPDEDFKRLFMSGGTTDYGV